MAATRMLPLLSVIASTVLHAAPAVFAGVPAGEVATTRAELPQLAAPVAIDLDAVDVPTIAAGSIEDAARAEGWQHARERFLQMDLARRGAAGELGEIVPQGIALDRRSRPLGLRRVAERAFAAMKPAHRALLEHYAEGVNAQLAGGAPLEYRVMRLTPEPWRPEDSLLVQLGMAIFLDGSADSDRGRSAVFATMPPEVARFLTSSAGALSMSVDGAPLPPPPALPAASALDLTPRTQRAVAPTASAPGELHPGSNAFAVAGSRTKDHRAIVGNDMHLGLTAPGIWYRVVLEWPGARLAGLSLPGVPLIVQGTNGHVAWGFTNLTADLADLILVETDPKDPARYLTAEGSEPFTVTEVRLGKAPRDEALTVRTTRFGPIVGDAGGGRLLALRWVFLEEGALDCGLFDMATATTLEGALDAARGWRGPPQNTLVAASDGRIGWTIAGSLPARERPTPSITPWRSAPAWRGVLPANAKPRIIDPESGILTSGNQLAIAPTGALAAVLGWDEAPGDRAHRMRELLSARSDWTETELCAVQLDVLSPRLVRWRDAILAALPKQLDGDVARTARSVLAEWNGRVDADASAPEVVDACRRELRKRYAAALGGEIADGISDEALLRMLESRAPHLAPAKDGDWTTLAAGVLADAAAATRVASEGRFDKKTGGPIDEPIRFRTRGSANISVIRHPAADALGPAAKMAEMPRAQLPGHPTCVRVSAPAFGASERSVISPAHLGDAILVTPCGQAGMPTSPHFRDLHNYWMRGEPFPLLPGEAKRRVELVADLPADEAPAPPAGERGR